MPALAAPVLAVARRTQDLSAADSALFFYIWGVLGITDDKVWPHFDAAKAKGIETWEQWADAWAGA